MIPCQLNRSYSINRFNRLAWGASQDPTRPYGILAGGLENGSLVLWDPKAIVDGSPDKAIIHETQPPLQHSGPVKGLDFNPIDSKILASGASNSEVNI